MGKKFTIGDCGDLTWFLGIYFEVSVDRMTLSHSMYISNLLNKFGMENCKPVSTPLAERLTLSKGDSPLVGSDEEKQMMQLDYRGLVGSISNLVQTTRPDLAFSAHPLSRTLNNRGQAHRQAANHVPRYLKGTQDVGLAYWRASRPYLTGFSDADYATCKDDRKSVAGFCFNYGVQESHRLQRSRRAWQPPPPRQGCMLSVNPTKRHCICKQYSRHWVDQFLRR